MLVYTDIPQSGVRFVASGVSTAAAPLPAISATARHYRWTMFFEQRVYIRVGDASVGPATTADTPIIAEEPFTMERQEGVTHFTAICPSGGVFVSVCQTDAVKLVG